MWHMGKDRLTKETEQPLSSQYQNDKFKQTNLPLDAWDFMALNIEKRFWNTASRTETVFQKIISLAVDDEQNTSDQRTYSCDDTQYATHAHTQKTEAGDDQKDSEQNPLQLTCIHFNFSFDL